MPRLMSVAYTEAAVRDRTKTVTRRLGWRHAQAGQRVVLCRKVMGRKKGEPLVRLVVVLIEAVDREPLAMLYDPHYGPSEVSAEGFPGMLPHDFVHQFFIAAQGIQPTAEVTRIQWSYLENACLLCGEIPGASWRRSDEWAASHYCMPCLNGPLTPAGA